jgi:hypothetical protein
VLRLALAPWVEASSSSCFSLIDEAISLDAPFSLLLGASPRLADKAAPGGLLLRFRFGRLGLSP